MHITLISACERRAVKRSRAILDSYTIRTGIRSWATITLEGLRELHGFLKASATRQTAVACYRNEGRERLRLLWVVGARDSFGPDGRYTGRTRRRAPPPFLAKDRRPSGPAAGLGHDLGKSGNFFASWLGRWPAVRLKPTRFATNGFPCAWCRSDAVVGIGHRPGCRLPRNDLCVRSRGTLDALCGRKSTTPHGRWIT